MAFTVLKMNRSDPVSLIFYFGKGEKSVTVGHEDVLAKIRNFVETTYSGRFEIYDLKFKPQNKNMVLEVMIDGPKGITVNDCETVSRSLSHFLDETELIHCAYILEVSSPGAERILKRNVDFERHVGRMIRWVVKPSSEAPKEVFKGRLQEFSPQRVVVMTEKGMREFPVSQVTEARCVLELPQKARG